MKDLTPKDHAEAVATFRHAVIDPVANSRRARPPRHPNEQVSRQPVAFDPSCIIRSSETEDDDENS